MVWSEILLYDSVYTSWLVVTVTLQALDFRVAFVSNIINCSLVLEGKVKLESMHRKYPDLHILVDTQI